MYSSDGRVVNVGGPGILYAFLDVILYMDIALTFKTPIYHDGEVSQSNRVVATAYIRSHRLFWDLLSAQHQPWKSHVAVMLHRHAHVALPDHVSSYTKSCKRCSYGACASPAIST